MVEELIRIISKIIISSKGKLSGGLILGIGAISIFLTIKLKAMLVGG